MVAGVAFANDLSVNPSVTISASTNSAGVPIITGSWQNGCSIDDAQTTYGWGQMKLLYATTVGSDHEVEVTNTTGLLGGEAGSGAPLRRLLSTTINRTARW